MALYFMHTRENGDGGDGEKSYFPERSSSSPNFHLSVSPPMVEVLYRCIGGSSIGGGIMYSSMKPD